MSDSKVSALSEVSNLTLDDLLYFVDNASPPVSYRISLARMLGNAFPATCQGRLTLASGLPVYAPQQATPSSTDTATEVCTFAAAHGWKTGTIVTVSATIGGLTAGTRYYINALSATTCAFYTTLANAQADSSRVNLTASITSIVIPSGITNTTIYFAPCNGSMICVYDGTRWKAYAFTELSLALGTLTSGKNYDVFIYDNSGTLTLELLVWTDDVTRATAIVYQDGIPCKSGALTRRLLGTIRTDSTTTTIDDAGGIASQIGGKRFVSNVFNQIASEMRSADFTATWNYSTNTWRQSNGNAGNKVEFVNALTAAVSATQNSCVNASTTSCSGIAGLNLDSVTAQPLLSGASDSNETTITTRFDARVLEGYHYIALMETGNGTVTATWIGLSGKIQSGISAQVFN